MNFGITIIEDAAHAFLTKYKGRFIGSGENLACFSFYATKNLTTAEGGMITCPSKKFENRVRTLSFHGISKSTTAHSRYSRSGSWRYHVSVPGYKYNLTDIQAALGLSQLPRVFTVHKRRRHLAQLYKKMLNKNANIILPADPSFSRSEHAWHLFTVQMKPEAGISRDNLINELKKRGIGTSVHFIPNHLQDFYRGIQKVKLPVTELVFSRILSLPLYEKLSDREVVYISGVLNELTYGKGK